MRVKLLGPGEEVHAEGDVPEDEIDGVAVLEREGRHYLYRGMREGGKAVFVQAPVYAVTEF